MTKNWDDVYEVIKKLYVDEYRTLLEVQRALESQGFKASIRSYREKIKYWNMKRSKKQLIASVRVRDRRPSTDGSLEGIISGPIAELATFSELFIAAMQHHDFSRIEHYLRTVDPRHLTIQEPLTSSDLKIFEHEFSDHFRKGVHILQFSVAYASPSFMKQLIEALTQEVSLSVLEADFERPTCFHCGSCHSFTLLEMAVGLDRYEMIETLLLYGHRERSACNVFESPVYRVLVYPSRHSSTMLRVFLDHGMRLSSPGLKSAFEYTNIFETSGFPNDRQELDRLRKLKLVLTTEKLMTHYSILDMNCATASFVRCITAKYCKQLEVSILSQELDIIELLLGPIIYEDYKDYEDYEDSEDYEDYENPIIYNSTTTSTLTCERQWSVLHMLFHHMSDTEPAERLLKSPSIEPDDRDRMIRELLSPCKKSRLCSKQLYFDKEDVYTKSQVFDDPCVALSPQEIITTTSYMPLLHLLKTALDSENDWNILTDKIHKHLLSIEKGYIPCHVQDMIGEALVSADPEYWRRKRDFITPKPELDFWYSRASPDDDLYDLYAFSQSSKVWYKNAIKDKNCDLSEILEVNLKRKDLELPEFIIPQELLYDSTHELEQVKGDLKAREETIKQLEQRIRDLELEKSLTSQLPTGYWPTGFRTT